MSIDQAVADALDLAKDVPTGAMGWRANGRDLALEVQRLTAENAALRAHMESAAVRCETFVAGSKLVIADESFHLRALRAVLPAIAADLRNYPGKQESSNVDVR